MTQLNFPLETKAQNVRKVARTNNVAAVCQKQKTGSTLQRKVDAKIEIIITSEQLKEIKWLFESYGVQKPGWLRRRFLLNQRRRKLLNGFLREAGLDKIWCLHHNDTEWSGQLHQLWHIINEETPWR